MPNEPQPDKGDLNQRAGEAIHAALERVSEHVDLDDDQRRAVFVGLIDAFIGGARLGVAEVTAQAIEHGIDLRLDLQLTNQHPTPDEIEP